jgi:hypothetical protein
MPTNLQRHGGHPQSLLPTLPIYRHGTIRVKGGT